MGALGINGLNKLHINVFLFFFINISFYFFELGPSIFYRSACAPSEDSDQSVHPHSLIRVFAGQSMGSQGS